jgi:hypothetical protein
MNNMTVFSVMKEGKKERVHTAEPSQPIIAPASYVSQPFTRGFGGHYYPLTQDMRTSS